MCGIFCSLGQASLKDLPPGIRERLQDRGPDSFQDLKTTIWERECSHPHINRPTWFLTFAASVLSLRGEHLFAQPVTDSNWGYILCWNGEAWRLAGQPIMDNDTHIIFKHLVQAAACHDPELHRHPDLFGGCTRGCHDASLHRIRDAIEEISGPFALVFFDRPHRRIFFARDVLGRRSLLYGLTPNGTFNLASVSGSDFSTTWIEVEADGLYLADLTGSLDQDQPDAPGTSDQGLVGPPIPIYRYPWIRPNPNLDPDGLPSLVSPS